MRDNDYIKSHRIYKETLTIKRDAAYIMRKAHYIETLTTERVTNYMKRGNGYVEENLRNLRKNPDKEIHSLSCQGFFLSIQCLTQ